jgi:acetoin utilization deacetylase AcuC-like enzyme
MRVGYISDGIYLKHETGFHPESKERLIAIKDGMKDIEGDLLLLSPLKASIEIVNLVHPIAYINYIQKCCK